MKKYFYRITSSLFLLISVWLGFFQIASAAEVSCSNYPSSLAGTCNQCFDEGSIYRWQAVNSFTDTFVNDTPNHEIMFNDFWGNLSYTVIQPGSGFRDTGNFTQFTPNLTWDTFNGRLYTAFAPNSRTDFLRFAPGGWIVFETASNTMDRNSPALRIEVLTRTYAFVGWTLSATPTIHKECAFYTPRWCGDGVVDAWESCDAGAQNGANGATCSSSCAVVPLIWGSFDLSIKKYVNNTTQDAQDGNPFDLLPNTAYQYIFRVKNEGPNQTVGTTTVSDPGPANGVNFTGTPTGNGWTCTTQWRGFSCTSTSIVQAGMDFPDIMIPATTTSATGTFRNLASVSNPNENAANNYGNNNTDPANVRVQVTNPICSSLNASPAFGVATLNSTLSCSYSNVPANSTLRIECGNGAAVANIATNSNGWPFQGSATCDYATAGTYTPRCTIFTPTQSITSNECTTNVNVTAPSSCTPGTTTGAQTVAVTAATAGLCPANQAVGGFTSTTVGTTTNYSWSCGGSPVGGLCVASFTPTAGICTPGTTTGAQTVAVTASTAGLCPTGQTVGGFTSTTVGTTTNYSWSCNGSPVGGLCVASFTPSVVSPICTGLTASVTSQTVATYSSVLTCTAGASAGANPTFQINCGNGQIINAATGTCNYTAFGTNAASCSVNGQTGVDIPNACRVNITSNPSGGGGPGTCQELSFSVLSNINNSLSIGMSCTATAAAQPNPTFEIDCGNGQTINGDRGTCRYSTGAGAVFPYTATCRVNGSTQWAPSASPGIFAPGSCRQSISYSPGAPPPGGGGGSAGAYCGNGIVDTWTKTFNGSTQIPGAVCTVVTKPQSTTVNGVTTTINVFDYYSCLVTTTETCDAGWMEGAPINNLLCVDCMTQTNVTTTNPRANPLFISYYPVDISRDQGLTVNNYQWIIGNNVPAFTSGDRFTIASPYPTILSGYSATIENTSNLMKPSNATVSTPFGANECIGAGQIDFGSGPRSCTPSKTLFTVTAGGMVAPTTGGSGYKFVGDTSTVTTLAAQDVNPPLSAGSAVLQNNFTIGIGYLREPLKVRVARQAVSNTAGGNAYIGARTGYSVNAITNEFLTSIQSGNFVVTSSASSNANALSGADSTSVTNTSQTVSVGSTGASGIAVAVTVSDAGDFNFTNFAKMGDANNIFTIKKGTVTIDRNLRLKGIGTLIIEEGSLIINGNITYEDANSSWAFIVVKPGASGTAIQIKNTVDTISGVYMAFAGEMNGSAPSIVQLSVDGNVYANIASLVNSRTFIRADEGSTALSTGVTINYSTRAFKNPPPLLSKYLEQYTLRKISR